MTRTEKYARLREELKRENDEHKRQVVEVSFDDWFKESKEAYEEMSKAFWKLVEAENDKRRKERIR